MLKFFVESWGRLIIMVMTLYTFGVARTNAGLGLSFGSILVVIFMILWSLIPIFDNIKFNLKKKNA
jgi:hypothetical protein